LEINEKQLEEIMSEMFSRVGGEYSKEKIKEETWYLEYSWTEEEQMSFHDWLSDYLKKKFKLRRPFCDKHAWSFIFNYGWSTKGGDSDG